MSKSITNAALLSAVVPALRELYAAYDKQDLFNLPNPTLLEFAEWCSKLVNEEIGHHRFHAYMETQVPKEYTGLLPSCDAPMEVSHKALDVLIARYLERYPQAMPSKTRIGQLILWVMVAEAGV